jgi:hypothetical protein
VFFDVELWIVAILLGVDGLSMRLKALPGFEPGVKFCCVAVTVNGDHGHN